MQTPKNAPDLTTASLSKVNQRVVNPLAKPVGLICDNPDYLNDEQIGRLMACFPDEAIARHAPATAIKDDTMSDSLNSLKQQLESMMRMQDRLMKLALKDNDSDSARKAIAGGKDLFNLFARFEEKIDRQSRQRHIELAVKETFDELGNDELKQSFVKILREKLVNEAKKV